MSCALSKKQYNQGVTQTGHSLHTSTSHFALDHIDSGVKFSKSILYLSQNLIRHLFFLVLQNQIHLFRHYHSELCLAVYSELHLQPKKFVDTLAKATGLMVVIFLSLYLIVNAYIFSKVEVACYALNMTRKETRWDISTNKLYIKI